MKSFYYVDVAGQVRMCRVKGNLFKDSIYDEKIAVGDKVEVDVDAAEDAGLIYKVLPRHSKLSRPIREGRIEQVLVSNADSLLIVTSIKRPKFRYGVVDRFIIAAMQGDLEPIIIINKMDIALEDEVAPIKSLYTSLGYNVLLTSACQKTGLAPLRDVLRERTTILAGHSGVGKSSLIQSLFPEWKIKIGQVNKKIGKGRHTTTLSEMFPLPGGGYIVDTPGIREMGLYQVSQQNLGRFFVEFEESSQKCMFKGCTHRHEPECGVKEAVDEQIITHQRYKSYCNIFESLS